MQLFPNRFKVEFAPNLFERGPANFCIFCQAMARYHKCIQSLGNQFEAPTARQGIGLSVRRLTDGMR
jgi:hypothetical protein